MFDTTIKLATKQLFWAKVNKNIFFVLLWIFSLSLTALGLIFAYFVNKLFDNIKDTVLRMSDLQVRAGGSPVAVDSQQMVGMISDNTIWVPIISGVVIIILLLVYVYRISVRRVIDCEERLITLELFKALYNENRLTDHLRDAVITYALNDKAKDLPAMIPTVELAEKSIGRIDNLLSKTTSLASRVKNRT
ncbi:exported hypothetical protein [Vibrio coralliirubri]|uniref:hypothetical protein n=1 Tax=Vibrio TaxID=662 RepID=UPI0006349539|nr:MULTISPECIES: hypothetical protein [Vibrio]CDT53185.1 exported hypothetical protein [Vibrio coralliirubri]